jgi:hypothetical protein
MRLGAAVQCGRALCKRQYGVMYIMPSTMPPNLFFCNSLLRNLITLCYYISYRLHIDIILDNYKVQL